VQSVEVHVLLVASQGGVRRGYDLYSFARTAEESQTLQPVLEAMLSSVSLTGSSR